jgi:hypothetical protein
VRNLKAKARVLLFSIGDRLELRLVACRRLPVGLEQACQPSGVHTAVDGFYPFQQDSNNTSRLQWLKLPNHATCGGL